MTVTPLERIAAMIKLDPGGEVHLSRNGKECLGYQAKDGVLYYAAILEVNLDEVVEPVNLDRLLNQSIGY